jgi:hypothetical protein
LYSPVALNADFASVRQNNGCEGIPALLSYFLILSSLANLVDFHQQSTVPWVWG